MRVSAFFLILFAMEKNEQSINATGSHSGSLTLTGTLNSYPGALTVGNGHTITDGNSNISSDLEKLREFADFALEALGIGIKYEQFARMNDTEKKAMLREIKINRIVD